MPEIIEVAEYTRFINKNFNGKKIRNISILKGRYKKHGPFQYFSEIKDQLPLKITNVESKGKFMYISLENDHYIGITLGLTGGWFYETKTVQKISSILKDGKRYRSELQETDYNKYLSRSLNHLNVKFNINGEYLYFYDQLNFGTIKIFKTREDLQKKLDAIGVDILSKEFNLDVFTKIVNKKNNKDKYIGNVLVNQKLLSGIGNYLRADILWMSKISPFRKCKYLQPQDISVIYKNIKKLVWGLYDRKSGIKFGYVSKKDKLPEDYNRVFFVYNSNIDPKGRPITKQLLYEGSQKRYIHWVKDYQV